MYRWPQKFDFSANVQKQTSLWGQVAPGNSHPGLLSIKNLEIFELGYFWWGYFFLGQFHNQISSMWKWQILYHRRPFNRISIFWVAFFVFQHVRYLHHQKNIQNLLRIVYKIIQIFIRFFSYSAFPTCNK